MSADSKQRQAAHQAKKVWVKITIDRGPEGPERSVLNVAGAMDPKRVAGLQELVSEWLREERS